MTSDPVARVIGMLSLWAAGSTAALVLIGIHPVIPLDFLLAVAFLVPTAWALQSVIDWAPRLPAPAWVVGLLCGGLYLALDPTGSQTYGKALTVVTAGFLIGVLPKRLSAQMSGGLWGVAGVAVGTVGVWSSQYLALAVTHGRMWDAMVAPMDTVILGHAITYPFVPVGGRAFHLLQSGYVFLFAEMGLVAFRVGADRQRLATFLSRMFVCYGLATAIFALVPIAGPYLTLPSMIQPGWTTTIVGGLIDSGQREFNAMVTTGQPVTGYGVFVGFPSLHIALIVLFQWTLRRDRIAFWAVLPINVAAALATVAFGFHYLIDLPAGALLAIAVISGPALATAPLAQFSRWSTALRRRPDTPLPAHPATQRTPLSDRLPRPVR